MIRIVLAFVLLLASGLPVVAQNGMVVYQTDFGLKDGAVSEMKGVAMGVSAQLKLFDLTHEIPAYNIWEAAYRLQQAVPYWPVGTVFVSVVDPGVGTTRKSVVLKTKTGQYIVTPDNGTLSWLRNRWGSRRSGRLMKPSTGGQGRRSPLHFMGGMCIRIRERDWRRG